MSLPEPVNVFMAEIELELSCEILPESYCSFSVTFNILDSETLAVCMCLFDVDETFQFQYFIVYTQLPVLIFFLSSLFSLLEPSACFCGGLSSATLQAPNAWSSGPLSR